LSIISYSLFIAAPLASAGVFIYKLQAEKSASKAITALDIAIKDFNDKDFKRLIDFEKRLSLSGNLVESHVSITALLQVLSGATAENIQFKNLTLKRENKDTVSVVADIVTPTLDSVLFQRGEYKATTKISDTQFVDVTLSTGVDDTDSKAAVKNEVRLKATFAFNGSDIIYTPLTDSSVGTMSATSSLNAATSSTETSQTTPNENTV